MTRRHAARARQLWRGDLASIFRGSLGMTALGLAAGLVLARVLDPDGRGLLAIALVWPAIAVTLVGLPGNSAVAFFAARNPDRQGEVVRVALEQTLMSSLAIIVLGLTGATLFVRDEFELFAALLIAFAGTPFMLVAGVGLGLLRVTDLKLWSRQRLVQPGVYTVSVLLAGLSGHLTVISGAFAFTVSQIVAACWVWWTRLRRLPRRKVDLGVLRRGTFIYGIKSSLAGSVQITNGRLDVATIGIVVSSSQVGIYAVAAALAQYIVPLATAAAPWVFPRLAKSVPTPNSWAEAQRAIRLSAALAAAGALLLGGVAPVLLGRVLGPQWLAALVPLWILLVGAVVQAVRQTLVSIASAYNRPGLTAQSEGVAAIVTVVGLWPMVQLWGINGAAVVSVFAYLTSAVLLHRGVVRTVRRKVKISDDGSRSWTTSGPPDG